MKQHTSICQAADCPSLDGGPVSTAHESRMLPPGALLKSTMKSETTAASNSATRTKNKNTAESKR